jgi:hypothetical protein
MSKQPEKFIIIPNNIHEMTDSSSAETPISNNGNNIHVKLDITNININGQFPQINKNEKVNHSNIASNRL